MSFTKVFGGLGALAGFGFGIFAAVKNFDPDAHQSEEMAQATRVFSELLTQVAMVGLQAGALSTLAGIAGSVVDCLTCCKFADTESLKAKAEEYLPSFRLGSSNV
jgi:hypothetical protein